MRNEERRETERLLCFAYLIERVRDEGRDLDVGAACRCGQHAEMLRIERAEWDAAEMRALGIAYESESRSEVERER